MLRHVRLLPLLFPLALLLVSCGSGGNAPILGGPSSGATAPAPAGTAVAPTAAAGSPIAPSTAVVSTPTAGKSPLDAATQAAVQTVGGVSVSDFNACRAQTKPCILHGTDPDSPDKGIAVFEQGDPLGGGAMTVYGQKADGSWAFWFGTQQQTYHATVLPAQMRVCADGTSVNLRMAPDETSTSLGLLKDDTTVTADRFVLTQPGSGGKPGPSGNGWYSISAPSQGFVRADFVSVSTLPDCTLRNALVASTPKTP